LDYNLYKSLRPCISALQDIVAFEFNNNGAAYGGPEDETTYWLCEAITTIE